jgi:hypothetical protein
MHLFLALLIVFTFPLATFAEIETNTIQFTKQGEEAAKLLGIENQVHRFIELKNSGKLEAFDKEALRLQLAIIRKIMTTGLELRKVSAKFDREIAFEQQALDKLTRERDFAIAATTNANFLQLSILSTIIDGPLAQSKSATKNLYGNRLNIVSGLTVGGLALISLLEQKGGVRRSKAQPNLLGQSLGLDMPSDKQLPPMLWTYLNSPDPESTIGLTRREQLLEYWKTNKVLSINIKKPATVERVSAFGPRHHWWNENIRLLKNRVTMLFDLRAMIDLLNTGLVELLQAME